MPFSLYQLHLGGTGQMLNKKFIKVMNNSTKIIAGFAAGALAGALTGLLLAPESGPKTRKRLTKESEKFKDSLSQSITEALDAAKVKYNTLLGEYTEASKKTADRVKKSARVNS